MPRYESGEYIVSISDAYEHAVLAVLRGLHIALPGIASWRQAAVNKRPTVIFDLSGHPLFFDFAVVLGRRPLGYARIAANQLVGSPGVALELGARQWDAESAQRKLGSVLRRRFPRAQASKPRLVCYSYPKLGLMYELSGSRVPPRVIFDVASLDVIPERPKRPNSEGAYAWSFLESLTDNERSRRLDRYRRHEKARRSLSASARRKLTAAKSFPGMLDLIRFKLKKTISRTLQYCDHYDETEPRSHHCFSLHAQEVNDYCAVATCQMVLCYYRYDYTQDDIAPDLGYSSGSGCPSDQSGGWETLTCDHLDASYDTSPTWEKGRDEIEALHPFKSGIPGHARACAGYSYSSWSWPAIGGADKKLYIYDPWPWNADLKLGGAVYWEDWDTIEHTNYVTARVNCS